VQGIDKAALVKEVKQALYASKICSYAQGLNIIKAKSAEKEWNVDVGSMARIWKVSSMEIDCRWCIDNCGMVRMGGGVCSLVTYCDRGGTCDKPLSQCLAIAVHRFLPLLEGAGQSSANVNPTQCLV